MDDYLPIPDFLIRTPENTPKAPRLGSTHVWKLTPAQAKQIEKDKAKAAKEAACEPVLLAVLAGDTTVGKIKKSTGLETKLIQQTLRTLIKRRNVAKLGRQYLPF